MFTIEQIKEAHSKVKTGADFPKYVKDINALGVIFYETHVTDGHTDLFGNDNFKISSDKKYDNLLIADESNASQFKMDLIAHQQGKTDFLTFCNDCATSGVAKWAVDTLKMTCTYYNKEGTELLLEMIPLT